MHDSLTCLGNFNPCYIFSAARLQGRQALFKVSQPDLRNRSLKPRVPKVLDLPNHKSKPEPCSPCGPHPAPRSAERGQFPWRRCPGFAFSMGVLAIRMGFWYRDYKGTDWGYYFESSMMHRAGFTIAFCHKHQEVHCLRPSSRTFATAIACCTLNPRP